MEYLLLISYVLFYTESLRLGEKKGFLSNKFYIFASVLGPFAVLYCFLKNENKEGNKKINPFLILSHIIMISLAVVIVRLYRSS